MQAAIRRTIEAARRGGLGVGAALVVALALPTGVEAAEFEVTSLNDIGSGSLREAIETANEHPDEASMIGFAEGLEGAITLESPLPELVKRLEIVGSGADRLTVARDPEAAEFRIFTVGSGSRATISGLMISGGRAGIEDLPGELFGEAVAGGGILVAEDGELTLKDAVVRDNVASSSGVTSIAIGGGIANFGAVTIDATTISGNLVETSGPASGSIALGGGIGSLGMTSGVTVRLSTVSENRAGAHTLPHGNAAGGGIGTFDDGLPTTIESATIAANAAEGSNPISANLYFTGQFRTGSVRNTILADPDGTRNCFLDPEATLQSLGHNLADDDSCELDGTDDQEGADPGLKPLADNGGPAPTHAITPGGPARDQGSSGGLTVDQRGFPRPVDDPAVANAPFGDGSDIGAFELQTLALAPELRLQAQPRVRRVGPNRRLAGYTFRVRNVGDAPTETVRLCARAPKQRVAIRGTRCVVRQIPEGQARQRQVRVRIKRSAGGEVTRIRLIARGPNVDNEQTFVRLRVSR